MSPLKPQASYDDFARLDIRIGKIVDVQPFPRARNPSYKVGVDVGADRIMWSSAQITNYEPAALLARWSCASAIWVQRMSRASHPNC
jgi:tRNA-binding protein